MVVVLAPVLDQDLRLGEAGEQLHREELVADASAEARRTRVPRGVRRAEGVPGPSARSRSATRQNLRRTSALIAAPKKRSVTADTGTLIKDVADALGRSTTQLSSSPPSACAAPASSPRRHSRRGCCFSARSGGDNRGPARMLVLMSKQVFERDPDVLAGGEVSARREFLADACALGLAWRIGRCGACCRPAPDRHGGYGARE